MASKKAREQGTPAPAPYHPRVVLTADHLAEVLDAYMAEPGFVLDVETIGTRAPREGGAKNADIPATDERTNKVLWLALACPGRVDIIPMGHPSQPDAPAPEQLSRGEVLEALHPLFFSDREKRGHNVLFDVLSLSKYWGAIPPGPFGDTMSLVHLLNENLSNYDLGSLVQGYLGYSYSFLGKAGSIDKQPFDAVAAYVGLDAKVTQLLWDLKRPLFNKPSRGKLTNILRLEQDITEVLIHAKQRGVMVNEEAWQELDVYLAGELEKSTQLIFECVAEQLQHPAWIPKPKTKRSQEEADAVDVPVGPGTFLISSTQQRAKLLYGPPEEGGLGLPCKVKTDSGSPSTSEKALKPLTRKHPVIPLLLQHAEYAKLKGTYASGFLPHIQDDNRIRARLNQMGTATGRFSSSRPNCFSGDTEVLTRQGWVSLAELQEGEDVAQWSSEGQISFVQPTAYVSYAYEGPMVRLRTASWDQLVTPDHRWLSFQRRSGSLVVEPASAWLRWAPGQVVDRKVARGGTIVGGSDDVKGLHLAVLAQAEGSWVPWCGGYWDCSVKGSRKQHQLLDTWPERVVPRGKDRLQVRVRQDEVEKWLDPVSKTFRVSSLLALSATALRTFLAWVMQWDGDFTRQASYGQHPDRARAVDAVQLSAVLTGHSTSRYKHPTSGLDVVNVHHSANRLVSRLDASTVPYSGQVYCLSVPSGFVLTRRQGDVLVVGQCQNIPRQTEGEDAQRIRGMFVAPPGYVLVVGDFAQVEYRVEAHFAGPLVPNSKLMEAFTNNIDLHRMTASGLFDKPVEEVTYEERQAGKTAGFCLMFGGGENRLLEVGLAKTPAKAEEIFRTFHATYPEVKELSEQVLAQCRSMPKPYVETLWGRRRRLPDITRPRLNHEDGRRRGYAERQAVNHLVQGTAADINKSAMVRAFRRIQRCGLAGRAFLVLSVHDEIMLEVPEDKAELGVTLLKESMEGVKMQLRVPLVAEVHCGPTWASAK